MNQQTLAPFIWNIADLLLGAFKPSEYGRIILPFTVLRRLECVLEPTRDKVRDQFESMKASGVDMDLILPASAGATFYNVSQFSLGSVGSTSTHANLEDYIAKFSANARQVFEHFALIVGWNSWRRQICSISLRRSSPPSTCTPTSSATMKWVWCLEAFASYARLLRKRLKGITPEQVDLGDLKLSHYEIKKGDNLGGLLPAGETPQLYGITDNGLRDAQDREKKYLIELIEKLNNAFGKDITDTDQVALAVHVSEKLRADGVVMAQVQNNTMEQAMKADLPARAIQAIAGAMSSHASMATKLLSDESTRDVFLTVVYELLKRDVGAELLQGARQ